MKKRKSNILKYIGYSIIIIIASYITYSVWFYTQSVENIEEFEVCYENHCVKTFHIHADIDVHICGQRIDFPLETGPLDSQHTHKERNYIHFHDKIPYDPKTGKLLDTTPLETGRFLDVMNMRFTENCIGNYCNGDLCPNGVPSSIKMTVNGEPNSEFNKYVWHDKDKIKITFE